jgi:hypothetical protein
MPFLNLIEQYKMLISFKTRLLDINPAILKESKSAEHTGLGDQSTELRQR